MPKGSVAKQSLGLRPSLEAATYLRQLSERIGISQTAIFELLVRDLAREHGLVPTAEAHEPPAAGALVGGYLRPGGRAGLAARS